jgi:hypothetical protein
MRFLAFLLAILVMPLATFARADAVDDVKKQLAAVAYADGVLKFHTAIEHLGQSFYHYGLTSPMERRGGMMLPVMRFPVPPNPKPEKIDYAAFRKIFETLVSDLDAAEVALAAPGEIEAKVSVSLTAVSFDFNADGTRAPEESLAAVLTAMMGPNVSEAANSNPTLTVAFDTADIHWMRGYGRFISAFAQFMLAHDFEDTFNKTFHLYFPETSFPIGEKLLANGATSSTITGAAREEGLIGDAIAFIHLINWKTIEPGRLADVRTRLIAMADLSAKSWAAARKETDNDREWLPNAKQTQGITGTANTDEVIDAWLTVMAEFRDILDGKKLAPHWRFDKGINMKRLFEESKSFDLVLLLTGTDAVNYLEDGPVSGSTRWNDLMRAFQGNFLGYAVWYN